MTSISSQAYCSCCNECHDPRWIGTDCTICGTTFVDHEEFLEAAWQDQQDRLASEPPVSPRAQHLQDWVEHQLAHGRGVFL